MIAVCVRRFLFSLKRFKTRCEINKLCFSLKLLCPANIFQVVKREYSCQFVKSYSYFSQRLAILYYPTRPHIQAQTCVAICRRFTLWQKWMWMQNIVHGYRYNAIRVQHNDGYHWFQRLSVGHATNHESLTKLLSRNRDLLIEVFFKLVLL